MLCKKTLKVLALSLSFSLALAGSAAALQPKNEFAASAVQNIQKGSGSFTVSDLDLFKNAMADISHFFQRGYQFSYQKNKNGGYIIKYVPNSKTAVSKEEAALLQSYVEPMVQKVAKMSVKDQLWYVYEKLSDETTYDYKLQNPNSNKAIACLRDHQSVCEGYTLAFREVCNRLNIPNIVVYSDGDANREAHCWNQVYLDGHWKNIDVTFSSTSRDRQTWFLSDTHSYDDCTDQEWVQLGGIRDFLDAHAQNLHGIYIMKTRGVFFLGITGIPWEQNHIFIHKQISPVRQIYALFYAVHPF